MDNNDILNNPDLLRREYSRWKSVDYSRPLREMQERVGQRNHHLFFSRRSAILVAATVAIALVVSNWLTYHLSSPSALQPTEQIVPRAQQSHLVLPDGTEVWLNAETTLAYDPDFGQKERRVCLTGEAYFKVKKDSECPFFVEAGNQVVKVVGTEFNVRAYAADERIETTLVSGRIVMSQKDGDGSSIVVEPGYQVEYDVTSKSSQLKAVDAEMVASWKEGMFVFEGDRLTDIMLSLSHWYDFTYEFADTASANTEIVGRIERSMSFADIIKILESTGGISFDVKGKHVIIKNRISTKPAI